MEFFAQVNAYRPCCEQEAVDREMILSLARQYPDMILTRACKIAHITGSGMIFNRNRDQTLMVFHNIYRSWSWTGGHADGEPDQLAVALREAQEETGITEIRPLSTELASVDLLAVPGHWKRGAYVCAHLHLSLAYLLEADEQTALSVKPDENSGVRWIPVGRIAEFCSEPQMLPVYEKLLRKAREA